MTSKFVDRPVLITGTSTGIGRATALRMARLGYPVFATVRKAQDANSLCAEAGENITPLIMDVTDPGSIQRARDEVARAAGATGLAGLVNNAGIGISGPLEFVPLEEIRRQFEVNFFGLLAVTQAFLPLLRQGRGRIVNVSSVATLFHSPFHGPYSASKMAVNGVNNSLRLEIRPHGVHVALLIVGTIHTPIWSKGGDGQSQPDRGFPQEFETLYARRHQRMVTYFKHLGEAGSRPESVASTIERALTEPHPRNTYYAGKGSLFNAVLDKLFFGSVRDALLLLITGIGSREG